MNTHSKVTFDLDANGILSVGALDTKTGAKAATTIARDSSNRNTPAEVTRMVAEAAKHAAADKALRKKVEIRRALENVIFDIEDDEEACVDAKARAEEADEWLRARFDSLSVSELEKKMEALRAAAAAR